MIATAACLLPRMRSLTRECVTLLLSEIAAGDRRLEAEVYLSDGFAVRRAIRCSGLAVSTLGQLGRIWQPSRLKANPSEVGARCTVPRGDAGIRHLADAPEMAGAQQDAKHCRSLCIARLDSRHLLRHGGKRHPHLFGARRHGHLARSSARRDRRPVAAELRVHVPSQRGSDER